MMNRCRRQTTTMQTVGRVETPTQSLRRLYATAPIHLDAGGRRSPRHAALARSAARPTVSSCFTPSLATSAQSASEPERARRLLFTRNEIIPLMCVSYTFVAVDMKVACIMSRGESDNDNGYLYKYVRIATNQPDTKSDPNL